MNKLLPPDDIVRTTLGDLENTKIPHRGVYVIAYMKQVVYVGRAHKSVAERLYNHFLCRSRISTWMRRMDNDWDNVRLDILEPPLSIADYKQWLTDVERRLIKHFKPLFNTNYNVQ